MLPFTFKSLPNTVSQHQTHNTNLPKQNSSPDETVIQGTKNEKETSECGMNEDRNKDVTLCECVRLMCDPDCAALQEAKGSDCHHTRRANMPVRQAPTGTFGIRWQIHNTRQQHDLGLERPTQVR